MRIHALALGVHHIRNAPSIIPDPHDELRR
jgi:hypothetical protein